MQQIIALWNRLDTRRRAIAGLASIAVFAAVLGLTHVASQPGSSLLYAGLDGTQAADVIAALDQEGVSYEVRGQSVYVESSRRDELRMILAGQGLPANTGAGYELLDNLSGFGTTSQMFDAAYWRAKEGELARTILASPAVRAARVHIANPSPSPFQRDTAPTASVTVTPMGGAFPAAQAESLRFLTASAVAGLDVADVTIIDAATGTVISGGDSDSAAAEQAEETAALKARVERLLEARVGAGRAIVEVSVDRVRDREQIVERLIDPSSRAAISTDTEESISNATDGGSPPVTVASNLPSGDADGHGDGSSSQTSQTRERANFEISETRREITRNPGAISRLTVAVLVDGLRDEQGWSPRPEAEMSALRELVASAVGYSESRGDVITLQSLEFEAPETLGTAAGAGILDRLPLEPMRLIQLAVFALVALALGLFVVRPILLGRQEESAETLTADDAFPALSADTGDTPQTAVPAADSNAELLTDGRMLPLTQDSTADAGPTEEKEDPITALYTLVEERQPDALEILRNWIEDKPARDAV